MVARGTGALRADGGRWRGPGAANVRGRTRRRVGQRPLHTPAGTGRPGRCRADRCTGAESEDSSMTGTDVLTLFSPEAGASKSQPAGNGSYAGQTVWGGWGSNPRPADYEETGPACIDAGRDRASSICTNQLGSTGTGQDRPGRRGTGRMFPCCSHRESAPQLTHPPRGAVHAGA